MSDRISIMVNEDVLLAVLRELNSALEPKVTYNDDPEALCKEAHIVKDYHIQSALDLLPTITSGGMWQRVADDGIKALDRLEEQRE